ncbi:MAG: MoaD/ThiS family protein [Flavobacteriales bacterium]|nr:MoaD/ThiS family protein [Flavobacteriales bacterium]
MEVKLFGMIAEKAGAETIAVAAGTVRELRQAAEARIDGLAAMSYAIAVDRRIADDALKLDGNEEVALLPPFAGG